MKPILYRKHSYFSCLSLDLPLITYKMDNINEYSCLSKVWLSMSSILYEELNDTKIYMETQSLFCIND